uniref:CSON012170 protein n=1 Tax=Culicoides sonorensis TaxID=179676 RepID=A0A336LQE1_CULSO
MAYFHRCMWTIIMIIMCVVGDPYSDNSNFENHFYGHDKFITRNNTKIMAQKGGMAILPCTVRLTSPATVSWIRRNDYQLLTVGLSTYSSDERFLVEHTRHMGHWALRIKNVQESDEGWYECQLSVHPVQSIFIQLTVLEAIAEIVGAPDLHIDEGSQLRLECKLKHATENPTYVFWYHEDRMVNYNEQDGYSVTSFQSPLPEQLIKSSISSSSRLNTLETLEETSSFDLLPSSYHNDAISSHHSSNPFNVQNNNLLVPSTSILSIREVHFKHGGNYTCAPSNARAGTITIHVLRGEKPAAMQHANRSSINDDNKSNAYSINCKYCNNFNYFHLTLLVMFINTFYITGLNQHFTR